MLLRFAILALSGLLFTVPAQTRVATNVPAQTGSMPAAGMHHAGKPDAVASTTITVETPSQSMTLSLADLQAMPQKTVKVHNGHTEADETYAGPLLADVLAKAGLSMTPKTEHDLLHMYLTATGTDGYAVVYSAAEVEPSLHKAEVIVAISQDGKPLSRTGAFQLIDSLEVKPARWVRNLTRLSVTAIRTEGVHP